MTDFITVLNTSSSFPATSTQDVTEEVAFLHSTDQPTVYIVVNRLELLGTSVFIILGIFAIVLLLLLLVVCLQRIESRACFRMLSCCGCLGSRGDSESSILIYPQFDSYTFREEDMEVLFYDSDVKHSTKIDTSDCP